MRRDCHQQQPFFVALSNEIDLTVDILMATRFFKDKENREY